MNSNRKNPFLKPALIGLAVTSLVACRETDVEESVAVQQKPVERVESFIKPSTADNAFYNGASIYEVNIRQYSEGGTINAVTADIPRLKAMGIDVLWLMPVQPIGKEKRKGELGSYYSVADYTAVNPEFGTLDDLKVLVETAHQHGQKVILDWVANHTAWDHPWITNNPDWYTQNASGKIIDPIDESTGESWGWTDVADLNYDNRELWQGMSDAMQFWLKEVDIDGFRCDVAGEVPTEFWNFVRPQLESVKPVFMLAEAEKPELQAAFDMSYGWEFHHLTNEIAKGEKPVSVISDYMKERLNRFDADHLTMMFTTNHDENSWNGTVFERYGDAHQAYAVLSFTIADTPLMYSGQESALAKRLKFFEKDEIDWADYPLQDFYSNLLQLKDQVPALWSGARGGRFETLEFSADNDKVVGFRRSHAEGDVDVWINLSDQPVAIQLPESAVKASVLWGSPSQQGQVLSLAPFESVIWGS